MPCLIKPDKHHTWLCIVPCLCDGCLLCCLLLSGVACSTSSVCLLHGLVLLPCGISGKMTIPSKSLLSLLASYSLYCYAALPTTCLSCLPCCHFKTLTHLVLANRCLTMLPLCAAPLIALLVAGEDWSCSLLEHGDVVPCLEPVLLVGISLYILFN